VNRDETLAFANNLLDWGVPVVVCAPKPDSQDMVPIIAWTAITNAEQCRAHLSRYRHGTDALALIGGHGIDVIDVDTKAGGSIAPFGDLTHFGVTKTPSGGYHYVIASTGLRKKQNLTVDGQVVGDYVGGTAGHGSRMIAYLPGSYRPNKYGDVQYMEFEPWDVEGAVLAGPDPKVVEILERAGVNDDDEVEGYIDDAPDRDPADGVHPEAQRWIDEELKRLDDLPQPWAPGSYWDDTTFQVACALQRIANSNWTGYSTDDALADLLDHAPADERWGPKEHTAKWRYAKEAVGNTGRRNPHDARNDFTVVKTPRPRDQLDVTTPKDAFDAVFLLLGQEGTSLAGLFRRGVDLVYTPRVGEDGYVEPTNGNDDGPLQIRRMTPTALQAYINHRYRIFKWKAATQTQPRQAVPAMFPKEVAVQACEAPELLSSLRPLAGVSHTPFARADGSVLTRPGYDEASRMLFLPDRGLRIPSEHRGLALLDELVEGFPFVSEHDRANYLGLLLTPLLRQVVPPAYPLFAIGAPQPGSGKSLLAQVLRVLHGGVFRAEMPRDSAEFRKQITSILDTTSAPVVTFDNMNGTLRSPLFESLLTGDTWTDRVLGATEDREIPNDRVWTLTGNNLSLGGDLKRRTVWITIDPKMEHPEQRTAFRHPDLPSWVEETRGEILAALLGLVTDWVDAGKPVQPQERTDSFGRWQQVVGAILRHAGVPGTLNHESSVRQAGLEDEDEWAGFLAGVQQMFGGDRWQVKQVITAVELGDLDGDDLPAEILDKMRFDSRAASKSLGRWVQNRADRWFDGRSAVEAGKDRNKVKYWRIVTPETDLL